VLHTRSVAERSCSWWQAVLEASDGKSFLLAAGHLVVEVGEEIGAPVQQDDVARVRSSLLHGEATTRLRCASKIRQRRSVPN